MHVSTYCQNSTQSVKLKPNHLTNPKYFNDLQKSKFEPKVNQNNGNETKLDIFPWDIFKSETISFLSKNIKVFQRLSKSKFLSFTINVKPNNRNETKSDMFQRDMCQSVIMYFFI